MHTTSQCTFWHTNIRNRSGDEAEQRTKEKGNLNPYLFRTLSSLNHCTDFYELYTESFQLVSSTVFKVRIGKIGPLKGPVNHNK